MARARPFPVIKDLVVDRGAFDRIIQAGGYITVPTGTAPEAHAIPVPKKDADLAFDAATCIGCGACVAACPNGSSMLFTAAKVTHLNLLPQGQPERDDRVVDMVAQQDARGLRRLHQHRRVLRGVPEGHLDGDHLAAEPRPARRPARGGPPEELTNRQRERPPPDPGEGPLSCCGAGVRGAAVSGGQLAGTAARS